MVRMPGIRSIGSPSLISASSFRVTHPHDTGVAGIMNVRWRVGARGAPTQTAWRGSRQPALALSQLIGSTSWPPTRTSKCRWFAVERPVLPTRPITCPASTYWPEDDLPAAVGHVPVQRRDALTVDDVVDGDGDAVPAVALLRHAHDARRCGEDRVSAAGEHVHALVGSAARHEAVALREAVEGPADRSGTRRDHVEVDVVATGCRSRGDGGGASGALRGGGRGRGGGFLVLLLLDLFRRRRRVGVASEVWRVGGRGDHERLRAVGGDLLQCHRIRRRLPRPVGGKRHRRHESGHDRQSRQAACRLGGGLRARAGERSARLAPACSCGRGGRQRVGCSGGGAHAARASNSSRRCRVRPQTNRLVQPSWDPPSPLRCGSAGSSALCYFGHFVQASPCG